MRAEGRESLKIDSIQASIFDCSKSFVAMMSVQNNRMILILRRFGNCSEMFQLNQEAFCVCQPLSVQCPTAPTGALFIWVSTVYHTLSREDEH